MQQFQAFAEAMSAFMQGMQVQSQVLSAMMAEMKELRADMAAPIEIQRDKVTNRMTGAARKLRVPQQPELPVEA
jgi:hypothetical protein